MIGESFGALDGEQPARIPAGIYQLRYDRHETKRLFGRLKLFVWFRVMTFGEHFEKRVCRYYGLRRLIGKEGNDGRFAVGWKSDFLREYATLFGTPRRLDRIAMTPFEGAILSGRIRLVTKGHDQRPIPDGLRYSVIEELLSVVERPAPASPVPIAPATAPPTSKPSEMRS